MSRRGVKRELRGFFGIGVENSKSGMNLGTLWRSADVLGAAFVFTIGRRYRVQTSDVYKSTMDLPLFQHDNFEAFYAALPHGCHLVGVELHERAEPLAGFIHPDRAVYLRGAEDSGLSRRAAERCHSLVVLPGNRSLNVAVAGSLVLYDRISKRP